MDLFLRSMASISDEKEATIIYYFYGGNKQAIQIVDLHSLERLHNNFYSSAPFP